MTIGCEGIHLHWDLTDDVDGLESDYLNLKRFAAAANEFATYIRNNMASIPNYGERWCYGEPISIPPCQ